MKVEAWILAGLVVAGGGRIFAGETEGVPAGARLSANPTTRELCSARIFPEPLLCLGAEPGSAENQRLAAALRRYQARSVADDFTALEQYLDANPHSPWAPALTYDLAMECYRTGWYSKALARLEQAWTLLAPATEPSAKALADRAAGELAYMYGRLGRMSELAALLHSVESRAFVGSATERIAGAKQGLWTMQHRPEIGFRCGPMALDRILAHTDPAKAGNPLIRDAASTTNGCSLSQVAELSRQVGLNYQMAYRQPGAPLLVPAVVNWKAGHYAALVQEQDGQYLLQDPTFGRDNWVSCRVLEQETSGYFLVPPGQLPAGWRPVPDTEGNTVFGKGSTSNSDPDATTGEDATCGCSSSSTFGSWLNSLFQWAAGFVHHDTDPYTGVYPYAGIRGMAVPDAHLMEVSLNVSDMPLAYTPPVGPAVTLVTTYNQREANQPSNFTYSNLGPKWTLNWLAYINDNPSAPNANVDYYTDRGGVLPFITFNNTTKTYAPQIKSQARLSRPTTSPIVYEMLLADGSKMIFDLPDSSGGTSRRVFLTQLLDPAGNALRIAYDTNFCIVAVTDAIGQVTTLAYELTNDIHKITKVTDPFGRSATFTYDASNRLAQITDPIGLTSQFFYDSGDFIQALVTPYGTNSFVKGESGRTRWLVRTYPDGQKDRLEYNESGSSGVPSSDPANTVPAGMAVGNVYLVYRDSFFWDRRSYAEPADYSKAHLFHWLHQGDNCSGILESDRQPLENRVWRTYDGQSVSYSEGTTDKPNAIGRVLDDGTSQVTRYEYNSRGQITNSIDPLGRSLTYIYDTNLVDLLELRQTTGTNYELLARFLYNTQHLPVASWDAAGQMTTNIYNARGQLTSSTNPRGETRTFSYDTNGYVLAVDGPLPGSSDTISFTYDSAGRVRTLTDVDGYTVTNGYDNLDRLTNISYADGTSITLTYDKLDRVRLRDRAGHETQYTYDAQRRLTSVSDPANRVIRLEYCGCGSVSALIDPQGRPTRWEYDLQGRPTARQNPDGSRVLYSYEATTSRLKSRRDEQGQIKSYSYSLDNNPFQVSYPVAAVPTPAVTYSYDSNYNRLVSMQDGVGTTTYTYYPVGVLGALSTATADGPWANDHVSYQYDELGRATNRAINGVAQTYAYDGLGRVTNVVNALGAFTCAYDGASARLADVTLPGGLTTHYDYFNNLGNRRLQTLTHRKPDTSLLSRFTYAYNAVGGITNSVQELVTQTNRWTLGYDAADQLVTAALSQGNTNLTYAESYDPSGNRLAETIGSTSRTFQYDALNQLAAADSVAVTNGTWEWDAEQRLTAVNRGTNRSEFSYDGLGRRVRLLEKQNGVTVSDRRFVWCGLQLCEEQDAAGTVQQRFFEQGVQRTSGPSAGVYFYTRDHLDSLRELVDASGAVRARYDYEPWGRRSKLGGDLDADWGFGGQFYHAPSGLYLALFRGYDPSLGRWLSRDPLGAIQGPNLYAYARNDPFNAQDPLGLCAWWQVKQAAASAWNHVENWWDEAENAARDHFPEAASKLRDLAEAAAALTREEWTGFLATGDAALDWIAKYPREFMQGSLGTAYRGKVFDELNDVQQGKRDRSPTLDKLGNIGVNN